MVEDFVLCGEDINWPGWTVEENPFPIEIASTKNKQLRTYSRHKRIKDVAKN